VRRATVALPAALALAAAGCGHAGGIDPPPPRTVTTTVTVDPERSTSTAPVEGGERRIPSPNPEKSALPPGDIAGWIHHRVALRARPGGRVVARLSPHTEFGSPVVLPIVRHAGSWIGVISTRRPNGRLGWLPLRDVSVVSEPVYIQVRLGRRVLTVRKGRRTLLRMPVAVGGSATPTPTGTFAVTDLLRLAPGSVYGCCAVALSGHQPNIAQGWVGGDRLAVHGTSNTASVGQALSHGCLRAYTSDLQRLMRLTNLGTRVVIRA
jgi:lipoprotein-anchoring transpeptidase ErfK/SrfK